MNLCTWFVKNRKSCKKYKSPAIGRLTHVFQVKVTFFNIKIYTVIMKISLCMIVKDEELTIGRAIKSAAPFADEVIVVDTGSTDKTVEIAKALGAKVYHFDWIDDFSAARNYSFSLARGDYLMWIDADEYISEDDADKICALKENACNDVYMFKTSIEYMGNQALVFYRERLVKASLNLKWEGLVHETVCPAGQVEKMDITINHDKKKQVSSGRNLAIYKKAAGENKEFTPRELYYFGRELYYNNEIDAAIEKFDLFLQKWGYMPDIEECLILLADCFLLKKLPFCALCTIEKYLSLFEPYAESLCKAGEIFFLLNDFKKSAAYYERAKRVKRRSDGFERTEYSQFIPNVWLTVIYYRLGKTDLALSCHREAVKENSTHPSVIYNENFFKNLGLIAE